MLGVQHTAETRNGPGVGRNERNRKPDPQAESSKIAGHLDRERAPVDEQLVGPWRSLNAGRPFCVVARSCGQGVIGDLVG